MNWRQWPSQIRAVMGIMHGSRAFGGPFQANISLTNRCNIRCIHCYSYSPYLESINLFKLSNRHTGRELPDGRLQKTDADYDRTMALIEKLITMGTRSFLFSGSGEPFLHKNILEFAERVKHAGGTCIANTNGTLLDYTEIDELIRLGFDELRVTTMGGTRQMYSITHPGVVDEIFDNLKNNLIYLSERKTALGVRRPRVSLVCIVITQNCEALFDFAEFARFVRADGILFRLVDDLSDAGLSKVVPKAEQGLSVREQLIEVKAFLESNNINHNVNNFGSSPN